MTEDPPDFIKEGQRRAQDLPPAPKFGHSETEPEDTPDHLEWVQEAVGLLEKMATGDINIKSQDAAQRLVDDNPLNDRIVLECGHGATCPPLENHEPAGFHGNHQFCDCCGRDVCEEPTFQPRNEPYESDDNLLCIPCTADAEDLTVIDVVQHLQAQAEGGLG